MPLVAQFRSSLENPQTPLSFPAEWLMDIFNGGRTDAGVRVSEMTAFQVSTFLACVTLIGSSIAASDLNVYQRLVMANGRHAKTKAHEHDLFEILHEEPNEEMTSFTWRSTGMAHALAWGNWYTEIQRNNGGDVVALWPRNPARTRPHRTSSGTLVFRTTEGMEEYNPDANDPGQARPDRVIPPENMLHVPGLTLDGRVGLSTVYLSRMVLGLALAAEKYGGKFFANNARPGGILNVPQAMSTEARKKLKESWQEAYGGENASRVAVLEEAVKWQQTSVEPEKAQATETRRYQKLEICSFMHVPPHMIGESEHENRANTEQLSIEFVTYGLTPWFKRSEQEFKRKLFPKVGRASRKFFPMHDTQWLLMPDAATRKDYYDSGKQWGWLSTNDIAELEHRNPIDKPWADGYWIPINMQDAERAWDDPTPAAGGKSDDADKLGQRFVHAYFRLFNDAFSRVLSRDRVDSEVLRRAFLPVFLTIAEQVYRIHAQQLRTDEDAEYDASRFLASYIDSMAERAAEWKKPGAPAADELAKRELSRATRAIFVEVYRAIAVERAKAHTEVVT